MNKVFTIVLVLIVIAGSAFIIISQSQDTQTSQITKPATLNDAQKKELAGSTAQYLSFTKADYDKALAEKKILVLNFYANWCPICRAEEPDVKAAFASLDNSDVVGFQVNFKDDQTDADEKALAKEFNVPYQHTKVILKNGTQVFKETAQWNKEQFIEAITKATK